MSRLGTSLKWSAMVAMALALTACFKFTPEVTALSSTKDEQNPERPRLTPTGSISSFSGRTSTSRTFAYKLNGGFDRVSQATNTSTSLQVSKKAAPLASSRSSGGSL